MNTTEQEFLKDLDKKIPNAAGRRVYAFDAAVYKQIVLGPVFLKYAGEPFAEKLNCLTKALSDRFAESDRPEAEIEKNLPGRGWAL